MKTNLNKTNTLTGLYLVEHLDILNYEVYCLSEFLWVGHSVYRGYMVITSIPVRLYQYGGIVPLFLVADIFLTWVIGAVRRVGGHVFFIAETEAVNVLVLEPTAITAASIVILFHISRYYLRYKTTLTPCNNNGGRCCDNQRSNLGQT